MEDVLTGKLTFTIQGRDEVVRVVVDSSVVAQLNPWGLHGLILEYTKALQAREAKLDAVTSKLMS